MKKIYLILFASLFPQHIQPFWFFGSSHSIDSTANDDRVKNYIGHLIDAFFDITHQDIYSKKQLEELKSEATYAILHSDIFTADSFNMDLVQQMVMAESLTFIQNKAYMSTIEVSNLLAIPITENDQKKIAITIAEHIRLQAERETFKASELAGIFANYIGTHLKSQIYPVVKEYVLKTSSSIPHKIYDLDEPSCNTCLEDFDLRMHKRIIFPCGHSLCKVCALIIGKHDKRCPLCRQQTINLNKVKDQLS